MSDGHTTAEKNSYRVTFHPAFLSRCAIEGEDGCEVYKQSAPHALNGEAHPKKHRIHIQGGKYNRDVMLDIHDPKHAIKHIRVEMYGDRDESEIGTGKSSPTVETFVADNTAETCPPICVDPGP